MTSLDGKLDNEVAALGDLSRDELVARWVKAYGCPPPKGVKRGLLERAAAWHLQARRLGGLSPGARRAIRDAVKLHRDTGSRTDALHDTSEAAYPDQDVTLPRPAARAAVIERGSGASSQARHPAGARVERQNPCRRCERGWLCLRRQDVSLRCRPSPNASPVHIGPVRGSSAYERHRPSPALCDLHPQVHRGRAGPGVQLPRCPA